MSAVEKRTVAADDDGVRLDRWFKRHFPAVPHGALEKLLRTGQVRVDGARAKANLRLVQGQEIRIPPLARTEAPREAGPGLLEQRESKELQQLVIHETPELLVLNKPPGLAVQGGTGTVRHLDRMIAAHARVTGERLRLVHRLDRDTSGAILLARTATSAATLAGTFKARETEKLYWALTAGVPRPERGRIDLALAKRAVSARGGREAMVVADLEEDGDAQRAVTDYAVMDRAGPIAWVALRPITGRTHQLRAHMAALGTPILGDFKYGEERMEMSGGALPRGLMLHARRLTVPGKGAPLSVTAPLPKPMEEAFALLGFNAKDRSDPFAEHG
jgi:23S rRNA pseudouridine955/2504/2580 synthase